MMNGVTCGNRDPATIAALPPQKSCRKAARSVGVISLVAIEARISEGRRVLREDWERWKRSQWEMKIHKQGISVNDKEVSADGFQ